MLLGQSIFQSVLTRLKEDQTEDEETDGPEADFRIRGLGAGFLTPEGRPSGAEADIGAYFDFLAEWPADQSATDAPETGAEIPDEVEKEVPAPEPVMPPHLLRLTEEEIRADLALSGQETEASLNEKRRQFAKQNHPDRVLAQFRDNATIRMKLANLLIDKAIKELFWRR